MNERSHRSAIAVTILAGFKVISVALVTWLSVTVIRSAYKAIYDMIYVYEVFSFPQKEPNNYYIFIFYVVLILISSTALTWISVRIYRAIRALR